MKFDIPLEGGKRHLQLAKKNALSAPLRWHAIAIFGCMAHAMRRMVDLTHRLPAKVIL